MDSPVVSLLVNVDVADLEVATRFYVQAFGLAVGRRLGDGVVELVGANALIHLLENPAGTPAAASTRDVRRYDRHWTPVHLDFLVDDLDAALERALAAGARQDTPVRSHDWGRIVLLSDPFGHGLCVIELRGRGYDALADPGPSAQG